jgi:hypothetical protein
VSLYSCGKIDISLLPVNCRAYCELCFLCVLCASVPSVLDPASAGVTEVCNLKRIGGLARQHRRASGRVSVELAVLSTVAKKLDLAGAPHLQLPLFRMQWQSSSTSARKLGRSERGFAFNIASACPETAGGFTPALTFFGITSCKQPQANSSQMNTCTKRGRGWGHYVTFIFVGTANPGCAFSDLRDLYITYTTAGGSGFTAGRVCMEVNEC